MKFDPHEDIDYLDLGEAVAWKRAIELFEADDVIQAYALAVDVAGSWGGTLLLTWRMIQAEYLTRAEGLRASAGEGVEVEWPRGVEPDLGFVSEQVREFSGRFGWSPTVPVLVSFLSEEADAPWIPMRAGYYSSKQNLHKISLPGTLARGGQEAKGALAHELMHAMVAERTERGIPIWLNEALATTAGRDLKPNSERMFREGGWEWLGPEDLSAAFEVDRTDQGAWRDLGRAYQQAAVLGAFLAGLRGETGFIALLDAFSDNGLIKNVGLALGLSSPVNEALKQTYGLSEKAVFARARG